MPRVRPFKNKQTQKGMFQIKKSQFLVSLEKACMITSIPEPIFYISTWPELSVECYIRAHGLISSLGLAVDLSALTLIFRGLLLSLANTYMNTEHPALTL